MTEATNASTSTLYCDCGTLLSEVCLIPGTDGCLACHELMVMEQTDVGVVLYDGSAAYMREFSGDEPTIGHVINSFDVDLNNDESIPF